MGGKFLCISIYTRAFLFDFACVIEICMDILSRYVT
jgi:hypothetical protein